MNSEQFKIEMAKLETKLRESRKELNGIKDPKGSDWYRIKVLKSIIRDTKYDIELLYLNYYPYNDMLEKESPQYDY